MIILLELKINFRGPPDYTWNEPTLDIHVRGSEQDIKNTKLQIHAICYEHDNHVLCSSSKDRNGGQKPTNCT